MPQQTEIIVAGTLKADGTLELDSRPDLPPGPVRVTLRREVLPRQPEEDLVQFVQRLRRDRAAAGGKFLNEAETEELIRELREEDWIDQRLRETGPPQ